MNGATDPEGETPMPKVSIVTPDLHIRFDRVFRVHTRKDRFHRTNCSMSAPAVEIANLSDEVIIKEPGTING